jgi:hypothetical protein
LTNARVALRFIVGLAIDMGVRDMDERPENNKEYAPEDPLPELNYKSPLQIGKTGKSCENVKFLGAEWHGEST